jgi:hypothetical protein
MQRPVTANPKQRYIAELLATGVSVREAAGLAHVKPTYIEVMMKGSLFALEVDRARDRLIRDRLKDFAHKVADELNNNLEVAKSIRDNPDAKDGDRLRAIELMTDRIVPRPKAGPGEAEASVRVVLSDDRVHQVRGVLEEAIDVTSARDS